MCVNLRKTNVRQKKTAGKFKYQGDEVEVVSMYKYLEYHFDEHLKYNIGWEALASSGGRALGAIISKFKDIKDSGYDTFSNCTQLGLNLYWIICLVSGAMMSILVKLQQMCLTGYTTII